MLTIPDVRQSSGWDCGRAAAFAVFDLFGRARPAEPWPGTPDAGTDPRTLEAVFWGHGLQCQAGAMSVADLRHHTEAESRPVIVLTSWGGGHYWIVRGCRNRRVYFHCPSKGPGSIHESAFLKTWQDVDRFGHRFHRHGIAVWNDRSTTPGT